MLAVKNVTNKKRCRSNKNVTEVAKNVCGTKNVTEVTKNVTEVAKSVCETKKVTGVT